MNSPTDLTEAPDLAPTVSRSDGTAAPPRKTLLWIEFLALFIGVPILMAVFFEQIQERRLLFGLIWGLAGVSLGLLWFTPGWTMSKLLSGPVFREWRLVLAFWVTTAAVSTAFVFAINPNLFLSFVLDRPMFWLLVMIAYPVFSAFPQEIIYRSLFFERYGVLFPNIAILIAVNGIVFGFGHLFYMNWITISMTAAGGAIMGWAYWRYQSLPLAWLLHALAGQIVFTAGLGQFFYSGAVN